MIWLNKLDGTRRAARDADLIPPFGGSIPPAPASQSVNRRLYSRTSQKGPPIAGFCRLVSVSGLIGPAHPQRPSKRRCQRLTTLARTASSTCTSRRRTHAITTTSERIDHWTKMRRSLARFSRQEASNRIPSLVDFITITPGFRLSVHTGADNNPLFR